MDKKLLTAILYLKDGNAVKSAEDHEVVGDIFEMSSLYSDSGIDRIIVFDLSEADVEHEKNIHVLKEINRIVEIPVVAGGNINRLEDIKKLLYAGCRQVIINASKQGVFELTKEGMDRFGKDKLILSLVNADVLFKNKGITDFVDEVLVLNEESANSYDDMYDSEYTVYVDEYNFDHCVELLNREKVNGIVGDFLSDIHTDIMKLKNKFIDAGIMMSRLETNLKWSDFKLNSDGLIPVIVQDYRTYEVLMLAYMNEEAFETTLKLGKMTYYSRSRKELWVKGMTSGHTQYLKSLTLDCDNDTILAKVSQVDGIACHTGARSCFFNELVKKDYVEKNPLTVFENVYNVIVDRKENPKKGSYTNYLFDKGLDKILKKLGEEATEIVIAAKNPDQEEIKYEICDFLYHAMVLMVEKDVTWEDIAQELSLR